jgi:hypothetical protein
MNIGHFNEFKRHEQRQKHRNYDKGDIAVLAGIVLLMLAILTADVILEWAL